MKKKIGAIIFARMDSTRLPGKALIKFDGEQLIKIVIKATKRIKNIDTIILATTNRKIDEPLIQMAITNKIKYYKGDLQDVAKRTIDCSLSFELTDFIRINGDSPFINIPLINNGIKIHISNSADLTTNLWERTYPYGVSCEILNVNFFKSWIGQFSLKDKEHVTNFFYINRNIKTKVESIKLDTDYTKYNLCVDTKEDIKKFSNFIVKNKGLDYNNIDICKLIKTI